jgi:hypothetical protein
MSEPILGPGDRHLEHMRDLERRVTDLERSRRMPFTTQRGGAFTLAPEDLNPPALVAFGAISGISAANGAPGSAGNYGVAKYDAKGDIVSMNAENADGMIYPLEVMPWYDPTPKSVTSGTFANLWECGLAGLDHDALVFTAALVVPAGTIAQVRVLDAVSGNATNVLEVNSANGNVLCNWLHPFTVGWGDDRPGRTFGPFLGYQVRRSAGAGTISAFPPRNLLALNRAFATSPSSSTPLTFV